MIRKTHMSVLLSKIINMKIETESKSCIEKEGFYCLLFSMSLSSLSSKISCQVELQNSTRSLLNRVIVFDADHRP